MRERNYGIIKNALNSIGFRFSDDAFERKDYRINLFKDRVLGGYFLTERW